MWHDTVVCLNVSCHTYRVAKTHRMPRLLGYFPRKSPTISITGSFAKNDPQLKASYGFLPPCINMSRAIREMTRFHVMSSAMCDYVWLWYVWHDTFICVTWLVHMCDMTHSFVWRDVFIRVLYLIHMRDVAHSEVWYDAFICVIWCVVDSWMSHDTYKCVMSHLLSWMSQPHTISHINASYDITRVICARILCVICPVVDS